MDNYYKNLSKEEAIKRIEAYGAEYDPTLGLTEVYDQLFICESLAESFLEYGIRTNIKQPSETRDTTNGNVHVYENGNGGRKSDVNSELIKSKSDAAKKLKTLKAKDSPLEIAKLLEIILPSPDTKQGHWLHIAQTYTPRIIDRVISSMAKTHRSGFATIKDPAAYFTDAIKHRAKRKSVRGRSKKAHE